MIRGILFDLDGTLHDRFSSLKSFIDDQHKRLFTHCETIPREAYVSRFLDLDANGMVWKDSVYETLVHEFPDIPFSMDELLTDYLTYYPTHAVLFSDINSTLRELSQRALPLGIVTNGMGSLQMAVIQALHLDTFMKTIVISELENVKKPNPEIFIRAAERLDVPVDDILFVGDHPLHDIEAAQTVGMKTAWIQNTVWSGHDRVRADFTLDKLSDLLKDLT